MPLGVSLSIPSYFSPCRVPAHVYRQNLFTPRVPGLPHFTGHARSRAHHHPPGGLAPLHFARSNPITAHNHDHTVSGFQRGAEPRVLPPHTTLQLHFSPRGGRLPGAGVPGQAAGQGAARLGSLGDPADDLRHRAGSVAPLERIQGGGRAAAGHPGNEREQTADQRKVLERCWHC